MNSIKPYLNWGNNDVNGFEYENIKNPLLRAKEMKKIASIWQKKKN